MARMSEVQNDGRGRRVAIAVSRFNEEITERLLDGALQALREAGVADDDVTVVRVPGAFELPLAAQSLCRAGGVDAVIALGAVIEGDTDHYIHVCRAATDGLLRVSLDEGTPVAFGVLTCREERQALDRAGGKAGNKGADVARAALETADALARIRRPMGKRAGGG
ncbi:MAG: 6,7-dimethyl-8-ribityllumazine synthase [Planctomycetota bacterium]